MKSLLSEQRFITIVVSMKIKAKKGEIPGRMGQEVNVRGYYKTSINKQLSKQCE